MSKQGLLRNMAISPELRRRGCNAWPPYLAAEIKIERITGDGREVAEVAKTLHLGLEPGRA